MIYIFKGQRLRQFSFIVGLFLITSFQGLFAQSGIKLPPPPRTVDLFEEELFGLEKYAIDSTFFALKPGNYKRSVTLDSTGSFITIQETIDDVEFYFPPDERIIHVRSESRTGYYDFGANRRRVERLRNELEKPAE